MAFKKPGEDMPSFDKVRRMGKKAFLNTETTAEGEGAKAPEAEAERKPAKEVHKAAEVERAPARDDEAAPIADSGTTDTNRPARTGPPRRARSRPNRNRCPSLRRQKRATARVGRPRRSYPARR